MKFFLLTIFLLISVFSIQAQKPYAIWCEDNTTLYFTANVNTYMPGGTFDGHTITNVWSGKDITDSGCSAPAWNETVKSTVTTVVFDSSFSEVKLTSLHGWFSNCKKLQYILGEFSSLKTSKVTDMSGLFYGCISLLSMIDGIDSWDTSNVTNMSDMFRGCSTITHIDVEHINTSNVTNMSGMFRGCSNLRSLNVSNFDTSNVTDMSYMFAYCSKLTDPYFVTDDGIIAWCALDVSGWNTSNVTNMSGMFRGCSLLEVHDVKNFITSNVTDMSDMFRDCSSTKVLDISNFDTSKVTNMSGMFYGCSKLEPDVSNFKTSNVTDMSYMFSKCQWIHDVSNFDTSNVTNMSHMFSSTILPTTLSNFNTSNVTDMSYMFSDCPSLKNLDISRFDTSNVTNMSGMFSGDYNLTSLNVKWFNTSNVANISSMFYDCSGLTNLDVGNFNTSNVTDMGGVFSGCSSLTSLDVRGWDTSNVTDMGGVFSGCKSLTSLDVSNFDTSNVTDMGGVFSGCSSLTSLDVSNFDTSNVTDMGGVFSGCFSLTSLDVSSFDTSNVLNMEALFKDCVNLTMIDVSNFDISKVEDMQTMFCNCENLKTIYCNETWSCNSSYRMFDRCFSLVGGDAFSYSDKKNDVRFANPNKYFTFTVRMRQSVSLNSIPSLIYGDTYILPSTTDQGLTLVWYSDNPSVANVNGNVLTIRGVGSACISTHFECGNYEPFSIRYNITTNKALLTVSATDCVKIKGKDNPVIFLNYSGFKNSDNESSLTQKPVGTTSASSDSPAGTYPITISGGQSSNYLFNYMDGTLTILNTIDDYSDITCLVDISKKAWHAQGTTSSEFAPYVTTSDGRTAAMTEHYEGNINMLGELMFQDIEGLENGEYELQVYANAYFTDGRGFSSDIYSGQCNLAYVSANDCRTSLSAHICTSYPSSEVYTLYPIVTDGRLHIGLTVEKPGCNWYTIQIKSLKFLRKETNITPQALWCYDTKTLFFLNDSELYKPGDNYNGHTVTSVWSGSDIIDTGNLFPKWTKKCQDISEVVIEPSFVSVMPKSLHGWFAFPDNNLRSISGLEFLNTSNVTDMSCMFYYCFHVKSLDVSGFDTSNVTDMSFMFSFCSYVTSLDVNGFDTSNVTNMSSMFQDCRSLEYLDVRYFNTANVTNMSYMFNACSSLINIFCNDSWSCNESEHMFYGCTNLFSFYMRYNADKTDVSYANPNCYFRDVEKKQTLSLIAIPTMTYGDEPYMLPKTTDEGLVLTWTSDNTSVVSISGNKLIINGTGTTKIYAKQNGNFVYKPFLRSYNITVNKILLTITANDCSKNEGEDNPVLTISYSGFRYPDNKNSLTKLPVVSTTATKSSPAGIYSITISGGESDIYEFNYVNGTLSIIGDAPLGDINGDGDINVFDIVEMVDYIMKSQYVVSADIVSDGVVDVFDLVEEVSIVMQQTAPEKKRRIQEQNETNDENVLTLTDNGHNALSIGITHNEGVIASQFILELSEGLQLKDITTDEAHHLSYTPLGNNRYLVISYSDENEEYHDKDDMIRLSLTGEGNIRVRDAMAVTSDRKLLHVQPVESEFATDIIEVADMQNGPFNVYSTTGTLIRRNTSSYEGLPKGIYIINGKKTMIR